MQFEYIKKGDTGLAACFYAGRKEAQALPITLTFHIGPFTVTIRVTRKERKSEDRNEKNNRHSEQ